MERDASASSHEGLDGSDRPDVERLATRIATLESRLMASAGDEEPEHDPDALITQLDAVRRQLAESQEREERLLATSIGTERIVADAGVRLAELGEASERAQSLEAELTRHRTPVRGRT